MYSFAVVAGFHVDLSVKPRNGAVFEAHFDSGLSKEVSSQNDVIFAWSFKDEGYDSFQVSLFVEFRQHSCIRIERCRLGLLWLVLPLALSLVVGSPLLEGSWRESSCGFRRRRVALKRDDRFLHFELFLLRVR